MYKLQEGRSTQNACMTSQSAGLPVWIRATEGTLTVSNWRCQNFLCAATPNGPGREEQLRYQPACRASCGRTCLAMCVALPRNPSNEVLGRLPGCTLPLAPCRPLACHCFNLQGAQGTMQFLAGSPEAACLLPCATRVQLACWPASPLNYAASPLPPLSAPGPVLNQPACPPVSGPCPGLGCR